MNDFSTAESAFAAAKSADKSVEFLTVKVGSRGLGLWIFACFRQILASSPGTYDRAWGMTTAANPTLADMRMAMEISQQQMALHMGLPLRRYQEIESGRTTPDRSTCRPRGMHYFASLPRETLCSAPFGCAANR